MQRRLVEELKDLEFHIDEYKNRVTGESRTKQIESLAAISCILRKIILAPDKSFDVVFKGIKYDFIYPTTNEDRGDIEEKAFELITSIINECRDQHAQGKDTWWMVTAFASGIDTLDMQIEIIKEDVSNRVDENGELITALPLDMDNYQINMQRPEIGNEMDIDQA